MPDLTTKWSLSVLSLRVTAPLWALAVSNNKTRRCRQTHFTQSVCGANALLRCVSEGMLLNLDQIMSGRQSTEPAHLSGGQQRVQAVHEHGLLALVVGPPGAELLLQRGLRIWASVFSWALRSSLAQIYVYQAQCIQQHVCIGALRIVQPVHN